MDMEQNKLELKNDGKFLVWVNERYYFELDLQPIQSPEVKEEDYVNVCTLVDSETCKALETIAFASNFFIPVFQNKDMQGFMQIGNALHEIAKKHNLEIVETDKMPKDKVRKDIKKISKKRIFGE